MGGWQACKQSQAHSCGGVHGLHDSTTCQPEARTEPHVSLLAPPLSAGSSSASDLTANCTSQSAPTAMSAAWMAREWGMIFSLSALLHVRRPCSHGVPPLCVVRQHREAVESHAALLPRSPPNNGFINGTLAYSMEASENATHVSAPFQ